MATSATASPSSDLRLEQAAAELGISTSTVRRLVRAGGLPTYRVGRSVRVPASAIAALKTANPQNE